MTFTEYIEVSLADLISFRAENGEHLADLILEHVDLAINGDAYDDMVNNIGSFDPDCLDCSPDEIRIVDFTLVACPRENVMEFMVEWERVPVPTLELVQ